MRSYLDFEKPVAELEAKVEELRALQEAGNAVAIGEEITRLEGKANAALEELYQNLHLVNRDMSRRLGAATNTDPARNAIALLDTYTTLLPAALDRSLEELRPLFDGWQTK